MPWLQVLIKHGIMPKAEAMLFVYDVESARALVDKLKVRFPLVDSDTIAKEVRLLH